MIKKMFSLKLGTSVWLMNFLRDQEEGSELNTKSSWERTR